VLQAAPPPSAAATSGYLGVWTPPPPRAAWTAVPPRARCREVPRLHPVTTGGPGLDPASPDAERSPHACSWDTARRNTELEISLRRSCTKVREGDLHAGDWGIHGSVWSVNGEELMSLLLDGGLVHFGVGESIVGELTDAPKDSSLTDALRRCPGLAMLLQKRSCLILLDCCLKIHNNCYIWPICCLITSYVVTIYAK
jgi:hypothetical protein